MTIREQILEADARIFKHFGRRSDLVLVGREMEKALIEEARPHFVYVTVPMHKDPVSILQDLISQYVGIRTRPVDWMVGIMVLPPAWPRKVWD